LRKLGLSKAVHGKVCAAHRRRAAFSLAAAAAVIAPLPACAIDVNWQTGTGNWSTPSNWLLGVLPVNADDAFIMSNDAVNRTVTYDFADAPLLLNTLWLDNTGGGTNTLLQSGNVFSAPGQYIGVNGYGSFIQTGGSNSLVGFGTNRFYLGFNTGGVGCYTLSGGTLFALGAENIGFAGSGAFVQTGGLNTAGILFLGQGPGAQGSYTMTDGTAQVGIGVWVGGTDLNPGGTAAISISGGSMNIAGPLKVWNGAGNGVHLSGGTLSATTLDLSGVPSLLDWTGGTLNLTNSNLLVGSNGLLGGSLSLSAGKALGISGTTTVTNGATLTLTGGTLTTGALVLCGGSSSLQWTTGTLNLTNSSLNVATNGLLGAAINLLPGQALSVGGTTTLAVGSTLSIAGGSATLASLQLANWSQLGLSNGTITLTGGAATAAGTLTIASAMLNHLGGNYTADRLAIASGSYALSGSGKLALITDATIDNGTVLQTGGTLCIAGTNGLSLAVATNAVATYSISAGTLRTPNLTIGGSPINPGGTATLSISGGTITIASVLKVWPGSQNAINLTGGTLSAGSLDVAGNSSTLHWTAGTLNLTQSSLTVSPGGFFGSTLTLNQGQALGVSGTTTISPGAALTLSGGSFTTGTLALSDWSQLTLNAGSITVQTGTTASTNSGALFIGATAAPSIFNHPAGPNAATALYLGVASTGTYNLGAAATLTIAGDALIGGQAGIGTFNQAGGMHTIGGTLAIGTSAAAAGTYNLIAGSLSANNLTIGPAGTLNIGSYANLGVPGTLSIASSGSAAININGGNISAGSLDVSDWSRLNLNSGTLTITAGTTAPTNSGALYVGVTGPAAVNHLAGQNAAAYLHVGYATPGTYALAAGSLTIGHDEYVGRQFPSGSLFSQTGGTHAIAGSLFIGTSTRAASVPMPTGANLDGTIDYGVAHAYADVFNLFRTPDNATYDASGNLSGTWNSLSYLNGYPNGIYKLSYTITGGTSGGSLFIAGMGHIVPGSVQTDGNAVTADVQITHDNPDGTGGIINLFASNIAGVHLLSPGYTSGTQIFTSDFLRRTANFDTLRLMDWDGVNFSQVTSWSQRATLNSPQTGAQGTAYENQIALANATRKDIWINIPLMADDDYIKRMADMFRDGLTSGAKVRVELSNEVWNAGFPQFGQNYNAALSNTNLTGVDGLTRAAQQYALRAAQASQIWQTEFGTAKARLEFILGGQIGQTNWAGAGLQFVKDTLGDPKNYFNAVAVAPYFGESANQIVPLGPNPDAIFNSIFTQINGPLKTSIQTAASNTASYGLSLYAYEGGDSLPATIGSIPGLTQQQGQALMAQLQDDPRMYQALQALFANWNAAGGGLFANFSHIGQFWGLLTDSTLPGSQKWDATMARMLYAGDATIDNKVDYSDFLVLKANAGKSGMFWEQGDFNHDGVVDLADLALMKPNLKGLTLTQAADVTTFVAQQFGTNGALGDRYLMSGPSTLSVSGDAVVGNLGGIGTFRQLSGASTIAGRLIVGNGVGSYTLAGGALTITGDVSVGYSNGIGVFKHTAGTHTIAGNLIIGDGDGSLGSYTLTGPASLSVSGNEYLGRNGGIGLLNQNGGAHIVTGLLSLGCSATGQLNLSAGLLQAGSVSISNGSLLNQSGGTLIANALVNHGAFRLTGGSAILGPISGTGTLCISNGAISAASISQPTVTVSNGGSLTLRTAASPILNSITNLQLSASGTLDLANHALLTNTSPASIKAWLASAYDATANQDWSGPSGLTSSLAHSNPLAYTVGYAYGGDPSAQDAGIAVDATHTLVRATLTGDANLDGQVDFFDITQLLGYKYNSAAPASYTDGDLNYDGVVDFFDLTVLLSSNYNSGQQFGAAHAAPTAAASPTAAVPEPVGMALICIGAAGLLRRRTRRC
jgi:hypothetical protein